ncbi:YozQ family protein [Bacillus sp. B15-48]|uniref:YozQ family protein n=1 Tax=Bacillus sp. B15-48 TaxID=1548601 RepID=UPI00193FBBED|nr:YozQ family protein [Bacillus sp. B15-48]MBM4761947.1 DUF4025 domain-containing protein [Bacillus sp. B15-48]
MEKEKPSSKWKIAGKQYQTEDYHSNDEASSGLAITHEQVSDAYMEGEIQAAIDTSGGREIEITRKGHE